MGISNYNLPSVRLTALTKTTAAGRKGDHQHSRAKALEVTNSCHWENTAAAMAHIDVATHPKGVCLRARDADPKTGGVHSVSACTSLTVRWVLGQMAEKL